MLCFCNHVNLIAVSEHHHHHPPLITRTFPQVNPQATPRLRLLRVHYQNSKLIIITLSSLLAYLMSTLFSNHRQISPRTLYSTFGPSTCVLGYGHAQNDLLLLSHVYSMSQILLVVYSSYTSSYFPSFESRLSSSDLFSELSLSFVFATHNLPILFSGI